jgi:hypothetical protein
VKNEQKSLKKEIGIIVEGESDKKLIFEICKKVGLDEARFQIEKISPRGGKTDFFGKEFEFNVKNIKNLINPPIAENLKKILLICDADFKENGKSHDGFQKTKNTLNPLISKLKKEFKNIEIDFFILPNNKNDCNLDSLFLQCATKRITEKSNCVDSYLKCLEKNFLENLSINKKDKLYSQLLISAIGIKENFKNVGDVADEKDGYWNFDCESLEPLKKFLLDFANLNLNQSKT